MNDVTEYEICATSPILMSPNPHSPQKSRSNGISCYSITTDMSGQISSVMLLHHCSRSMGHWNNHEQICFTTLLRLCTFTGSL